MRRVLRPSASDQESALGRVGSPMAERCLDRTGEGSQGVAPGSGLAIEALTAQVLYDVHDVQATCAVFTGFVNEV